MRFFVFGFGGLRVLMALAFSAGLFFAPESLMPGAGVEPARTLALSLATRLFGFGIALAWCLPPKRWAALRWLFVFDAGMQVLDVSVGLRTPDVTLVVPVVLFALDLVAAKGATRGAGVSATA